MNAGADQLRPSRELHARWRVHGGVDELRIVAVRVGAAGDGAATKSLWSMTISDVAAGDAEALTVQDIVDELAALRRRRRLAGGEIRPEKVFPMKRKL